MFLMLVESERIVSWNCRGVSSKEFLVEMNELIRELRPKIVIIIEPRISGLAADNVCKRLGKKQWIRSEARGFSGGIWVL